MLSILILSDSYNGYGAEHMLKWLGNQLVTFGHKVTFCSLFDKERDNGLDINACYFQLSLPPRVYNLNYFIKGAKSLCERYKKDKYDYVITFHTNPYLLALISRIICGYKLLHSERDNPYARKTIPSRFKSWLYRYADKVVFQTVGAQNYFDSRTKAKSVVIPNPIIIPRNQWRCGINKTIVSVGRLDVDFKRQDILLKAFAIISAEYPDYNLVFYGDGKDYQKLEIMANELGVGKKVRFLGKVTDISERLIEEGIFVLTSDSEGMPNALMEAMSIGMPVISTDCQPGGARALIRNNVDGILIKRSSENELVSALKRLLSDKSLQYRLGNNARNRMKIFNPELIANSWMSFINNSYGNDRTSSVS